MAGLSLANAINEFPISILKILALLLKFCVAYGTQIIHANPRQQKL